MASLPAHNESSIKDLGVSVSASVPKTECQPCCRMALNCDEESKHEQVVLSCGHIGCNLYKAGHCIVCDSEQSSRRCSELLLNMSGNKGFVQAGDLSDSDSDSDDE